MSGLTATLVRISRYRNIWQKIDRWIKLHAHITEINWERVLIDSVILADKLIRKHMHVKRNRASKLYTPFLMLFSPREIELKPTFPVYFLLVFPVSAITFGILWAFCIDSDSTVQSFISSLKFLFFLLLNF